MISILLPVKNGEAYLEECLDSIMGQSISSWELWVVNDHSKDRTENILKEYAQKDPRINYCNNVGFGIVSALRTGYKNACGTMFTRMDSDDIMPAKKLEIMQALLNSQDQVLVTGRVKYISEGELGAGYKAYQNWLNELIVNENHYQEIYKECVIPSPCWMVSRKTLESCGAFESETYPEDYDLCFRFYENKIKVVTTNELLHIWRDHDKRVSRNSDTYAQNTFFPLKMEWFVKIDHDPKKKLVLWGAGKKGKQVAKLLNEKKIPFSWLCSNDNKIGHRIYEVKLENPETFFKESIDYQSIMVVSSPSEQIKLKEFLKEKKQIQAFWFC